MPCCVAPFHCITGDVQSSSIAPSCKIECRIPHVPGKSLSQDIFEMYHFNVPFTGNNINKMIAYNSKSDLKRPNDQQIGLTAYTYKFLFLVYH